MHQCVPFIFTSFAHEEVEYVQEDNVRECFNCRLWWRDCVDQLSNRCKRELRIVTYLAHLQSVIPFGDV